LYLWEYEINIIKNELCMNAARFFIFVKEKEVKGIFSGIIWIIVIFRFKKLQTDVRPFFIKDESYF
ncbi:hypothetical protein, partial [Bacillus cereus]